MNQSEMILKHLQKFKSITSLQALRMYGCFRLSARIWELRRQGYNIKSEMVKLDNGKKVARYYVDETKTLVW